MLKHKVSIMEELIKILLKVPKSNSEEKEKF